jgi:IclR family transcriptional regulator, acetate operon repressor
VIVSSVKQVQSIRKACAVVEAVAVHHSIGVSELARVTGLDKSAVHRIAVTLHQAGWFQPTPGGRWQLTNAFGRVARSVDGDRLLTAMRPALEELRDETGETVLLVTPDRERLVVQAVVESPNAVRMSSRVGAELPVTGSAAARAIAAHLPADELASLRSAHAGLDGDRALETVRRRGWAVNDGEVFDGARAVAAPVLAPDGYPLAAVVVCGPTSRIPAPRLADLGERTAAVVTHRH